MKTQHTPGPWKIIDLSICSENGHCIAVIEDDGGYEAPLEERKANAQLIAALPELLEALDGMVMMLHNSKFSATEDYAKACAAIAKATNPKGWDSV